MGLFYQRLDTVGDGSGDTNMNVDGSSTPVIFRVKPDVGEALNLSRIMIYVQDSGTMDAVKWGNGIVMSTGIEFRQKQGSTTTNILGFNVLSSGEMTSVCHDITHEKFGSGDEFISWRWTFTKAGLFLKTQGSGRRTSEGEGDEFQVVINDNFSGLEAMYVMAQGYY